ncbi:MAG: metallophosphoesterase [Roseovarius pacificus]|nr:metallophosphoesterase [Roseovarius pacificus]
MRRNELSKRKWYCADPHFGHDAIVQFCNRPFKNADEADEAILRNMHERVGPDDQLWLLGDFALGRRKLDKTWLREMFDRLPGAEQHLIVGNHDDEIIQSLPWTSVSHIAEVRDGTKRQFNTLFHYPMHTWNHARRGLTVCLAMFMTTGLEHATASMSGSMSGISILLPSMKSRGARRHCL